LSRTRVAPDWRMAPLSAAPSKNSNWPPALTTVVIAVPPAKTVSNPPLPTTTPVGLAPALTPRVEAKQKRAGRSRSKSGGAKGGNVIDLMTVLKKSLEGGLPQRG